MSDKIDGGPAFPSNHPMCALDKDGNRSLVPEGMSLRDWFAGQALAGVMDSLYKDAKKAGVAIRPGNAAEASYRLADAMLAERKKNV
ncbi:MAG: hypothetical protein KOO63_05660 [Bacteroidales bacterium]|nr:hypothetical protein [Candidatus Latescibacterota bacterium]